MAAVRTFSYPKMLQPIHSEISPEAIVANYLMGVALDSCKFDHDTKSIEAQTTDSLIRAPQF